MNKRRDRPGWWTPETVLKRLQAGEWVTQICRLASEEVKGEVSVKQLRHDVQGWAETASYGPALKKALQILYFDGRGRLKLSKGWYEDFFAAMAENGGKATGAAEVAGVSIGIVLAIMDRRNSYYDRDFTERFRAAEGQRVGGIREKYLTRAEEGDGVAQEKVLAAAMPHLHGPKQEMVVSGEVDHHHEHQLVGAALPKAVVQASASRTRGLLSGRREEVQVAPRRREPDVVEAEFVGVAER